MSYSIMAEFADAETKEKMFSFLKENYRTLRALAGMPKPKWAEEALELTDDLAYSPEEEAHVVGFNYGARDMETSYAYALCYWMAVTAGKRKTIGANENMPYALYDGAQELALFVNRPADKTLDWVEVDEFGFRAMQQESKLDKLAHIDAAVRAELVRLTELWRKNECA